MTPTLYLHIGLPKTGTTTLQKEVFPRLSSLTFLDKPRGAELQGVTSPGYGVLDQFFRKDPQVWAALGDALFDTLLGRGAPETDVLISDEGVGTAGRRPTALQAHLERFREGARSRGFGAVKALCSVRRQDQWLGSHYAQISHRIERASQGTFEAYVNGVLSPTLEHQELRSLLDYHTLWEHLVAGLGRENVRVVPFEQFAHDPEGYLGAVLRFMGRPAADAGRVVGGGAGGGRRNVRSDRSDGWALRPRSLSGVRVLHLRPSRLLARLGLPARVPLRLPERGRDEDIVMTERLRERVLAAFAESNRAFAAASGVDLSPYGYAGGQPIRDPVYRAAPSSPPCP